MGARRARPAGVVRLLLMRITISICLRCARAAWSVGVLVERPLPGHVSPLSGSAVLDDRSPLKDLRHPRKTVSSNSQLTALARKALVGPANVLEKRPSWCYHHRSPYPSLEPQPLSLSLGRGAEGGEGRERGSLPSSRSGCSRAVWTDERDGLGVVGGRQSIGLALPRRGAQSCPPSEPLRK